MDNFYPQPVDNLSPTVDNLSPTVDNSYPHIHNTYPQTVDNFFVNPFDKIRHEPPTFDKIRQGEYLRLC